MLKIVSMHFLSTYEPIIQGPTVYREIHLGMGDKVRYVRNLTDDLWK